MVEDIHIQHPAVKNGTEMQLVDVRMSRVRELPPTLGGVTQMADIEMTGPIGSPDFSALNAVRQSREPMRLRTGPHVGMWLIEKFEMPGPLFRIFTGGPVKRLDREAHPST